MNSNNNNRQSRYGTDEGLFGGGCPIGSSKMSSAGPLIPLKTTLELRGRNSTITVYIAKVLVKQANKTLNLLRGITGPTEIDLQHLRRFAKHDDLPHHLRQLLSGPDGIVQQLQSSVTHLYLMVGPTSSFKLSLLKDSLCNETTTGAAGEVVIRTTAVPALAPTSQEQALTWSNLYWPTVYKKSNPFGPHPSVVSRAEQEMAGDLHNWMDAAAQVAASSKTKGYGEAIGATIVYRDRERPRAVAVAGDARWKDHERDGIGNPMGHAVLRSIGMVAQKLKTAEEIGDTGIDENRIDEHEETFLDSPLSLLERDVYESVPLPGEGYLCHGLEIYLTHEPCVMCSMALLHSRFSRIIFCKRMPRTGGICSETSTCDSDGGNNSLGYGLFWRRELNWSCLAWQTSAGSLETLMTVDPNSHA